MQKPLQDIRTVCKAQSHFYPLPLPLSPSKQGGRGRNGIGPKCVPSHEAHVQESVRLVQDQHVRGLDQDGQIKSISLPAEHVLQATGRGDDYIGPGGRQRDQYAA